MTYSYRHPAVTVTVDGGLDGERRFAVRGRVAYSKKVGPAARKNAGIAAFLAMIAGVSRQAEVGRTCGARAVSVRVAGDPGLSDAFRRIIESSRSLRPAKAIRIGIPAHH